MSEKMKGSVEQLPSGKYRLRVTVGKNANGNPKRVSKTVDVPNIRKAYVELDKWIEYLEENGYQDLSAMTFKHFYNNMWKKEIVELVEERTIGEYQKIIKERFLPKLKDKKLIEIKPYQIKDIVVNAKRLDNKPGELSRKTKKRMLNAVSSLFNIAKDQYRIIDRNPVNDIKLPKDKSSKNKTPEPYSINEIALLLKTINEHASLKTKSLILTAFITGARQGEIAALEEKHINYADKTITFSQRITKGTDGNYKRVDGLKSDTSKTLPVPESYLDVMRNFMLINKKARVALGVDPKHKYIFGSPEGKFELPTSLYRNWVRFAKKHNLREIRFHDLRHTSASYLLSNPNITVKAVQEHLGHKDYRTTMNIYAHALEENKRETSNMFDDILTR